MEKEEKFREAVEQFGEMASKVVGNFVFNDTPTMIGDSLANIDDKLNSTCATSWKANSTQRINTMDETLCILIVAAVAVFTAWVILGEDDESDAVIWEDYLG